MVNIPIDTGIAKAGAAGGATAAVAEVTVGLERAAQVAGDTLRNVFGGLPWEMDPTGIVDAVAGGAGDAAGTIVPFAIEVVNTGVIA